MPRPLLLSFLLLPTIACGSDSGGSGPERDAATDSAMPDASEPDGAAGDAQGDGSGAGDAGDGDIPTIVDAIVRPQCRTDLQPGEKEVLYDGFASGSEGIAFDRLGRLFVTTGGEDGKVWELGADGTAEVFAEVPHALGLAGHPEGGLVVASIGASISKGVPDGAVYRVGEDGAVTRIVDGIDSPNFVVMMDNGDALVSDDFDTRVWRVTMGGEASVAIPDVESPNGMALSPDGAWLHVVSTFSQRGPVTRFSVRDGGASLGLDEREELATLGRGATADGMAIDADGALWIAANLKNKIVRMEADGSSPTDAITGLKTPASLAFGAGAAFDPCSLYVTELYGTKVWRVATGVTGRPLLP